MQQQCWHFHAASCIAVYTSQTCGWSRCPESSNSSGAVYGWLCVIFSIMCGLVWTNSFSLTADPYVIFMLRNGCVGTLLSLHPPGLFNLSIDGFLFPRLMTHNAVCHVTHKIFSHGPIVCQGQWGQHLGLLWCTCVWYTDVHVFGILMYMRRCAVLAYVSSEIVAGLWWTVADPALYLSHTVTSVPSVLQFAVQVLILVISVDCKYSLIPLGIDQQSRDKFLSTFSEAR